MSIHITEAEKREIEDYKNNPEPTGFLESEEEYESRVLHLRHKQRRLKYIDKVGQRGMRLFQSTDREVYAIRHVNGKRYTDIEQKVSSGWSDGYDGEDDAFDEGGKGWHRYLCDGSFKFRALKFNGLENEDFIAKEGDWIIYDEVEGTHGTGGLYWDCMMSFAVMSEADFLSSFTRISEKESRNK